MPPSSPSRVATLVLFHNGYGDYVMALPTLRAFCATAQRPLALAVGDGPQLFLLNELDPDLLLPLTYEQNWPSKDFDPSYVLSRITGCDTFLSLCPYESSGERLLVKALGPRRSIGFSDACEQRLPYKTSRQHEIDVLFQTASCLAPGVIIEDFSQPIAFTPEILSTTARMKAAFDRSAVLVVTHVETRPERTYPRDRFDRLLNVWTNREGVFALLLNENRDLWPAAAANGRCGFLRGASLQQSMAIAASADVFIGVDSCMLHVADLARRPGVGLFSPTDPRRVGFRFSPRPTVQELRAITAMNSFDDDMVLAAGFSLIDRATANQANQCAAQRRGELESSADR